MTPEERAQAGRDEARALQRIAHLEAEVERLRRALHNGRAERDRLRTEQAAVHGALRDALGTEPATVGQAAKQAVQAIAERNESGRQVARLAVTVSGWQVAYNDLTSRALRLRWCWDSARRGRAQAREQLKVARPYIDWLHEQRRAQWKAMDRLAADRAYIAAAVDRWQDGTDAPHDVLTAIRDRLTAQERGPR